MKRGPNPAFTFLIVIQLNGLRLNNAFSPLHLGELQEARRSVTHPLSPLSTTFNKRSLFSDSQQSTIFSSKEYGESTEIEYDWQEVAKDVFAEDKRPVILFDGVCNLCNGGVNFALDNDSKGSFRFASLQSTTGKSLLLRSGKTANDISSIVLVTEDTAHFKSDAVLRISEKLDGHPAFRLIGTTGRFVPSFLRNSVYNFVANNRYRFGEADQCRLDFGEYDDRFFKES
mmetsp:Transcript_3534/g.4157  ORF Transcript_3534/g.4157 Transcript_3534/m.4157 type:complete len:229 (+) Transcript_3534:164-850(+)